MSQIQIQRHKNSCNLDIDNFIKNWNLKYPYDRWWRKKYNVPFGSKKHKKASFIDMAIEYKEDMWHYKMKQKEEDDEINGEIIGEKIDNPTIGGKKVVKMSKKDLDIEFADLNLDDFNDKK